MIGSPFLIDIETPSTVHVNDGKYDKYGSIVQRVEFPVANGTVCTSSCLSSAITPSDALRNERANITLSPATAQAMNDAPARATDEIVFVRGKRGGKPGPGTGRELCPSRDGLASGSSSDLFHSSNEPIYDYLPF
jgi:hypothetical protein